MTKHNLIGYFYRKTRINLCVTVSASFYLRLYVCVGGNFSDTPSYNGACRYFGTRYLTPGSEMATGK